MGSATNSHGNKAPVPLLVLRLPQLEQIAWRNGKRAARRVEQRAAHAFRRAAAQILRREDRCVHERGSDIYAVVISAGLRGRGEPGVMGCRAILARMAHQMEVRTGQRPQTGWTLIKDPADLPAFGAAIESALERGAREQARYEFFAAVGHELRTPLTSIRGYLETLIESGLESATAKTFLQTAQRETLRMGRLIDGMLEFSLLDLSALPQSGCSADLKERVALAADALAPVFRSKGLTLTCDVDDDLIVCVEPDVCLQLLINLLENAAKYSCAGGRIAISSRAQADDIVIAVDDDGPGIAPADRESIFALRWRGSTSAGRPGAGIGLAIVKLIVERAGGTICAGDSALGGARFEVRLPRQAELWSAVS